MPLRGAKRQSRLRIGDGIIRPLTVFAITIPASVPAFACSVCFGDPDSLQSKALGGAVLFLLMTVGGILAAITGLTILWSRRAKKLGVPLPHE